MMHSVRVIEISSGELVKLIVCKTMRQAEKVAEGLEINLNHDKYFVEVK